MPPKDKKDDVVTAADAGALHGVPAPGPTPSAPKPFLSEGMRSDLETLGWAVDPVSGARYEMNMETGEVTVTEKGALNPETGEADKGKVTTVEDVPVTIPATVTDPLTGHTTVTDPVTGAKTVTDEHGFVISQS